jgi:cellulose synthase/poly-beta-1,6-N-acetylglucosamine synthase-like glycosyltransferase
VPIWLFILTSMILALIIFEIFRLIPQLLRELKYISDFTLSLESSSENAEVKVSVIIPAKDEATNILEAGESILASTYRNLELVLVDDRSQDGTWELMERLRQRDSRVKTIRIDALPNGWTGKTHALFAGAEIASGNILLFTDADASFAPDVVGRALEFFVANKLDMLGLIPGFKKWGLLERAVYPHMALGISYFFPMGAINDPNSNAAVASGCFIMISAEAYQKVGTWKNFRNQITEDIAMAKAVKSSRMKLSVSSSDLIKTKPFDNIVEVIRFWRRTFYGGLENRPGKILRLWLNYTPLLLPFGLVLFLGARMAIHGEFETIGVILFLLSLATILTIEIPFGIFLKHYHGKWSYTLLSPLGIFTGFWIATWLLFTKIFGIGIEWRGSVYK